MAQVKVTSSKSACFGMLAGMLLLGLAAVLVVMMPSPNLSDAATEGVDMARRLQTTNVTANVLAAIANASVTPAPTTSFGHMFVRTGATEYAITFVELLLGLCFAYLYKQKTVDQILLKKGEMADRPPMNANADDFENGICGCFDDPWVCIHGLCCPLVRMAHTNAVSGVMSYWESICVFFCCSGLTAGLGTCCLMVYWRKQLKGIMGIEDHMVNDICVTCFCPNLSVCQQGSAVDRAIGYEVTGCCELDWLDPLDQA